jgi:hypothetical protein
MYLIYLDESHDENHYVISSLIIPESSWNKVFDKIQSFRREARKRYQIPLSKEFHARELGAGRGWLRPIGKVNRSKDLTKYERSIVYKAFTKFIGNLSKHGVKSINACIPISKGDADEIAIDRVLNRIQRFLRDSEESALLIFDHGNDKFYRKLYRQRRVYNPIPSMFGSWGPGESTRNLVLEKIVGDTFSHDSKYDYLIQAVDFIAFSLLKKEDPIPPKWVSTNNLNRCFEGELRDILITQASRRDELGVVRA